MKTDFCNKDFALSLTLKWRLRSTRKWPIESSFQLVVFSIYDTLSFFLIPALLISQIEYMKSLEEN